MFTVPFNMLVFTNFIILIWFLIDLYQGYRKGLLLQVLAWVSTFVALVVAWLFSSPLGEVFPWFYSSKGIGVTSIDSAIAQQVNRMVWFFIAFVVIRLLLLAVTPLASFISKMPLIKQVNSTIGGLASMLLFVFKLVLVCLFLTFPVIKNGQEVIDASILRHVEAISEPIFSFIDETIAANSGLQSIIAHQQLDEEQSAAVISWLESLNFSETEIMEYLKSYE